MATKTEEAAETKPGLRPMTEYIKLPNADSLEGAYLEGMQCKSCKVVQLYVRTRRACPACQGHDAEQFTPVRLSDKGEIWIYTIVHQSWPGITTPFVGAIIDVPVEGQADRKVAVRANVVGVEPDPKHVKMGMKVRAKAAIAHKDAEGNEVVVFEYEPV